MNAAVMIGVGAGLALFALAGKGNAASVPQAIADRVAAALATGNPIAIRLEAGKLAAQGYTAQASDLNRAAARLEGGPIGGETGTPAALLAPKPTSFGRGASGPEVSSWQTYLRTQGYSAIVVDGQFGVATEDATKAFQRARGLTADGVVGPDTLRASSLAAPAVAVAPPVAPAPAPVAVKPAAPVAVKPAAPVAAVVVAAAAALGARVLKRPMTGADVAAWQTYLVSQGYSTVVVDGQFGEITEIKTRGWQKSRGLTADAIVGPESLRAAATAPPVTAAPAVTAALPVTAAPAVTAASPVLTLPAAPRVLKTGVSGADVAAWQTWLKANGYGAIVVDGQFGPGTSDATKAFQRQRGLIADGVVGPDTLRASVTPAPAAAMAPAPVVAAAAAAVVAAVGAALPAFLRTLSKGASGEDVRAWQVYLRSQGYSAVMVDGIFGPGTQTASAAWQKSRGLTADGIVGPASWKAASSPASTVRVSGDVAFAADSPLPGIVPPAAPRLVDVSADRSLAARLALHLSRVEQGHESRIMVEQFQRTVGLNPTGAYGPGTARALLRYGHCPPWPFFWPSQGTVREKERYREALLREAARDPARAREFQAAASRG